MSIGQAGRCLFVPEADTVSGGLIPVRASAGLAQDAISRVSSGEEKTWFILLDENLMECPKKDSEEIGGKLGFEVELSIIAHEIAHLRLTPPGRLRNPSA